MLRMDKKVGSIITLALSVLLVIGCSNNHVVSKNTLTTAEANSIIETPPKSSTNVKFIEVSTGAMANFTVALASDGTVWTWGDNEYGQLGDGTRSNRKIPALVQGIADIKAISSGSAHVLALKEDGTVWSWGRNSEGELGNGTVEDSYIPIMVTGLPRASSIAAGYANSMALTEDGTIWAWGDNSYTQLGSVREW